MGSSPNNKKNIGKRLNMPIISGGYRHLNILSVRESIGFVMGWYVVGKMRAEQDINVCKKDDAESVLSNLSERPRLKIRELYIMVY
jgi:hypothetical protein